ncbi:MAG: diacylglycerol kinase family protein [Gemmatimonadota bacterium]
MADGHGVQVIATTISGSIADWGKMERIVPLFRELGRDDVELQAVDSHVEARRRTRDLVAGGCRRVISAGGSGTFNAVLEGCIDSDVGLVDLRLGFLRKGSADLIGKVLGMPDDVDEAVRVFVDSLAADVTVPCDVLRAESRETGALRHLVGYGGAEIFGRIPRYTENRFIKYYKGVLGQLFGDLGPFFVGASLAAAERTLGRIVGRGRRWTISVDGEERARGRFQAMILVNGDLGDDLPFARGVPLGSGDFHLFCLRDLGARKLPGQFRRAFDASILDEPERWGFEHHRIGDALSLRPDGGAAFPFNVDGSTLPCAGAVNVRIVDRVRLMAAGA